MTSGWPDPVTADHAAGYRLHDNLWTRAPVTHREGEYDSRGFSVLARMQAEHFWYLGRRRFIAAMIRRHVPVALRCNSHTVDLGAGCGGFIHYLASSGLFSHTRYAVADSSVEALHFGRTLLPAGTGMYQIDLMDLGWSRRWNMVFMLDVLEHLPDDAGALRQVFEATRPGGYCVLTVPALRQFWSWNDEIVGHQRRYSLAQLKDVVRAAGFQLVDVRYFMFLLSPLLLASRLSTQRRVSDLDEREKWALVEKTHAIPSAPFNQLLHAIFSLEVPLGRLMRFPWGTSAIAIARRP